MKKNLFLAAAAVAMLASCSQNDLEAPVVAEAQQTAIEFGTYLGNAASSRAGWGGNMTIEQLKESETNGGGFGIFAYHTDNAVYSSASAKPNFMYNQGVFFDTDWKYSPVKYWPNEANASNTDGAGAKSEGVDRVSFFAYAPYVETASGTTGITAFEPANNTNGDPKVSYTVDTDADTAVDLLWGVIASDVSTWPNVMGTDMGSSTDPAFTVGKPYLNLLKPKTEQKVKFNFKHALAKINVGVQAVVDATAPTTSKLDANETKIYIRSITITSKTADGFGTSGKLNLNNTTENVPLWEEVNKTTATELKADETGEIHENLFWSEPANSTAKDDLFTNKSGVTESILNIVTGAAHATADKGWMVVPTGDETKFSVNIDYFVMTKDSKLEDGYSIVENNITKDITVASPGFVGGKKYQINLRLGLTSVKVDAIVTDWVDGETTPVDLPINVN